MSADMDTSYICATCGKLHEGPPFSFGADFPDMYANMKREDRENRSSVSSDQCIIDEKWFFIRGCLEIPIIGDDVFVWGLWAIVYPEVFDELHECWELQSRETKFGPYKARLANSLALYPETLNLKLTMKVQPVGVRPLLLVDEPDHPLAIEQRTGITKVRALEWHLFCCITARIPDRAPKS